MRKQNKKTEKGKKGGDERRIGVGYVNRDVGHGVPRAMAERCVIRKDVFKKHFDEQATACSRDWSVSLAFSYSYLGDQVVVVVTGAQWISLRKETLSMNTSNKQHISKNTK